MPAIIAKPITATPITARPLTAYRLGESTDGANQLVWHALAANSSGVITDQIKGAGTPTWAHTSSLLLPDYQGVYRAIGAGEAPIVGARWVGGVPYATDELGDPLTDWWFQCQPAYTNSLTYSNDLTNWSWTKGSTTAALNAVGLTGAPNTASTLTDANAGVVGYSVKSATCADDSAVHSSVFYIAKDSDEARFCRLGVSLSGGTVKYELVVINTKTGAITANPATDGSSEIRDAGLFWAVICSLTNNSTGNTSFTANLVPAYNTDGSEIANAAATGSCIVGNVELHLNKTIAQVRGSAPIITAASTVSTTAVYGTFDIANHSDTKGAYMASVNKVLSSTEQAANAAGGQIIAGNRLYYADSSAAHSANDGTTTVSVTDTWAAGATVKLGVAYEDGGNMVAVQDGTAGTPDSYDGDWSATFTIGASANKAPILIKDVRRYNLSYTAGLAKLEEIAA